LKKIENQTFSKEREFYASENIQLINCKFTGEEDGESAFKESKNIHIDSCWWNLRYPFWHVDTLKIEKTTLTENCRAALWYTKNIDIVNSNLHGIKALRECSDIKIENSSIISLEFGWFNHNISMINTSVKGEYFMLKTKNLNFENVNLDGKYSFQYIENATFTNCYFNTKDAFWHGKNIIVKDSIIKGEYLAWYSEDLTFINCKIIGTQPLCYCKNLKLINCEMENCDLSFEKSNVEASITSHVVSIKNPTSGTIKVQTVGELILNDPNSKCNIIIE
jgi:hypothetical protein